MVLFDALEDASFREVQDMNGIGTLKYLESGCDSGSANRNNWLRSWKTSPYAWYSPPTLLNFIPVRVLGIINDLSKALADNNTNQINMYLQQLGKTPFFKKQKPTPYDEAMSLVWYLENVFYPAAGRIVSFLKNQFPQVVPDTNPIITMGFWPGGDRDGNPFVTADTTLKVADLLRGSIIKCYYLDVRRLKRRLTFKGIDTILADLEKQLYDNIFIPGQKTALSNRRHPD